MAFNLVVLTQTSTGRCMAFRWLKVFDHTKVTS
jgi:hypothetical protein